ncbi:hypothetical protein SAMN05660816_01853 [Niastella yeongjuensis]|nr:hypothetical protein SAMN05660816_01853 [Niastella yeongjuensis]
MKQERKEAEKIPHCADKRHRFFTDPAPIRSLVVETLCNPVKDLDNIFEDTLSNYEKVDNELPGLFKNQYLVTLELLRDFREQKKL